MNEHDFALAPASDAGPADQLDRAVAAYLTRFTGSSREHVRSDLRCFLAWCSDRNLHPLATRRPHLELYIRWMQEVRHFKPSTVSRRFSVVAGFYQTAVIDGGLDHSPAEHVRRPAVPPESPTLGLTHLQFEAMLTASRESVNPCDFALVAMLGLLGLRIFEATSGNIAPGGRQNRMELISRSTERLMATRGCGCRHGQREGAAAPDRVPAVVRSGKHVAIAVVDFHGRLGIERGRQSLDARRWEDAAADAREKVLETGAEGVDASRRLGNETLDRARSVTGKLPSGIAERVLRRRGDDEERDEEG